jgi:hypothetical protein
MRWEDQELNHATPENKFPEVLFAGLSLLGHASKHQSQYLRVDQQKLDEMVAAGTLNQRAAGARIDRLCLHFRLFCRLGPGGDHYPALGITHFWQDSVSLYAVLYFSPQNDWLDIMVIKAPAPNKSPEPTPIGAVSSAIAVCVIGSAWLSFLR